MLSEQDALYLLSPPPLSPDIEALVCHIRRRSGFLLPLDWLYPSHLLLSCSCLRWTEAAIRGAYACYKAVFSSLS